MENETDTTMYEAYVVLQRITWPGRDEQMLVCGKAVVTLDEECKFTSLKYTPSLAKQGKTGYTVIMTSDKALNERAHINLKVPSAET